MYKLSETNNITYACETWYSKKGHNSTLAILERKVLRNIFEPICNTELGIFERRKMMSYTDCMENPIYYYVWKLREWSGLGMYGELLMIP